MTPGEILGLVTAGGSVLIGVFTIVSKGRETAWSQAESIRKSLQEQIDDLIAKDELKNKQIIELTTQVSALREEINEHKRDKKTFIEFLEDFISGSVDQERLKTRAKQLCDRYKGSS